MFGAITIINSCFGIVLLSLALIDLCQFWLPDTLTMPLIPLGFVAALSRQPAVLLPHILGAIAGFFIFYFIARLYRRLRGHDGLGLGDAKMLAGIGSFVSWTGLPPVITIASIGALLFVVCRSLACSQSLTMDGKVAFGPFLALGGWIVWIYGPLGGNTVT